MFANMNTYDILMFVLSVILITKGLISIFTGRVFEFNASRYTEDSLRAYVRPMGFCNLAIGLGLLLFHLLLNTSFTIGTFTVTLGPVVLAIMIVVSIVLLVNARSLLVMKQDQA